MISGYDYAVIAFYMGFMLCLGVVFRGLSRNTSDYFRCGGSMPWWITGSIIFPQWLIMRGKLDFVSWHSGKKV
jgi:Na+/proline symporter